MSDRFDRYAVFHAPAAGPLADFAAAWLGWDAQEGQPRAHPDIAGLPRPVSDLTKAPRKYGFHATLKPPFRLTATSSEAALRADLADLASSLSPVTCAGLAVRKLGAFIALMPEEPCPDLNKLAGRVVVDLDRHRAHAPQAELDRRRAAGLSAAQEANLLAWGYPWVLDAFRFHMTLTGRLPAVDRAAVLEALTKAFTPLLPRPFLLDSLCLFGERDGRFHLIERFHLTGRGA